MIIKHFLEWFKIDTPILDSRDYAIKENKTDMLISMCKAVKADAYLSNLGSMVYVEESHMAEENLDHYRQSFTHPIYDQGTPFIKNLSAIDILFNIGSEAHDIIVSSGQTLLKKDLPTVDKAL